MRRCGRPPAPGLLTSRELEVLGLLREGLSNREIAERLGISLQGAKYHVSEIISKLGVSSREEAAAWRGSSERRWALAPVLAAFNGWRESAVSLLAPKPLTAALIVPVLIVGLGLGGLTLGRSGESDGSAPAAIQPTPTPDANDPCARFEEQGADGCLNPGMVKTEFTTLEEAATETSFVPLLPAWLPDGMEMKSLVYARPAMIPESRKDIWKLKGPEAPFEWLWAEYVAADGRRLLINQGALPMAGSYDTAPEHLRGKLNEGDREVIWYKGSYEWERAASLRALGTRTASPSSTGRSTVRLVAPSPRSHPMAHVVS